MIGIVDSTPSSPSSSGPPRGEAFCSRARDRFAIRLPSSRSPSSSSNPALDQSLPLASLPPASSACPPLPPLLLPPTPLAPLPSHRLFVVTATHARSRGYVVEPLRGHRIIIGWQVTRTLSPGFNWPIIVARIDGAAGPDRRKTFGVACSPSDTTRLSVTNISWQYRVPTERGSPRGVDSTRWPKAGGGHVRG